MIHPCCLANATPSRYGDAIFQCATCGLAWQSPQPSGAELDAIYSKEYYNSWDGGQGEAAYWGLKVSLAHSLLKYLPSINSSMKILDIGCATGACLAAINERGMNAYGIDVNDHAVRIAAKNVPSATIRIGMTEDIAEWEGMFDAVIMSDVIEHVRSPLLEMKYIHRLLRPSGTLIVLTPNIGSFSAITMQKYWTHLKDEHLFYFSRLSLQRLIVSSCFKLHGIHLALKPMSFQYAANQFKVYPIPVLPSLFSILGGILPNNLQRFHFSVPIGEMVAVAEKM